MQVNVAEVNIQQIHIIIPDEPLFKDVFSLLKNNICDVFTFACMKNIQNSDLAKGKCNFLSQSLCICFCPLSISVSLPLPLSASLSLSLSVMQVCNESLCVYMCAYFWRQLMFSFLFTLSSLFPLNLENYYSLN